MGGEARFYHLIDFNVEDIGVPMVEEAYAGLQDLRRDMDRVLIHQSGVQELLNLDLQQKNGQLNKGHGIFEITINFILSGLFYPSGKPL